MNNVITVLKYFFIVMWKLFEGSGAKLKLSVDQSDCV